MTASLPSPRPIDVPAMARLIGRRLGRWLGEPDSRWKVDLVSHGRSHGGVMVLRARDRQSARSVAVKVFRERDLAEAEHDHGLDGGPVRARVARALHLHRGLGLVVSEWIDGDTLALRVAKEPEAAPLEAAGRWLREFHRAAPLRLGPARPFERLDAFGALLRERPPPLPEVEARDFRACLAAAARRLRETASRVHRPARLHGDFHPRNLILSPSGPVAVDLPEGRLGSRYDDLARMTVQLEVTSALRPSPGGIAPAPARAAFLDAYGLRGRRRHGRLEATEQLELIRAWYSAVAGDEPRPAKAAAVRAILRRRGWLLALVALFAEHEPPDRLPRDAPPLAVAASA